MFEEHLFIICGNGIGCVLIKKIRTAEVQMLDTDKRKTKK